MQPDDTVPKRHPSPADDRDPETDPTLPSPREPRSKTPPKAPSAQAPGDLTGQVLSDKYRVVRLLGEGGFGSVYEAKDEMLGASVAVKVLTPAAAQQEDALQQFLGEARLLTSLDHPNIVRWITFDRTPAGLHYFVMEILKGSELSDVFEAAGRLPHKRVTNILLQVLSALRAAHFLADGRSLLHLDLKPRNVFVMSGEPEQIKVIDFGISQHVGAAARSAAGIGGKTKAAASAADLGATIATISAPRDSAGMISENGVQRARGGTLLYASPEQCRHLRGDPIIQELDGRSDLYSLGIMAFQLLTGTMPWLCRTQTEAITAHLESPPPKLAKSGVKVPSGLGQFVERCLAKDRDARYADVKEAYEALHRVANPPSKWPQIVGALTLVAALVVWMVWPDRKPDELTLPTQTVFFGPRKTSMQLPVGSLLPELADQPARWVVDPQSAADAMPGWTVTLERVGDTSRVKLAAPATAEAVDRTLYLRIGDGSRVQFSPPMRVVYLPPAACTMDQVGVRGAESRIVDPVGAVFEIGLQAADRAFLDKVQVSLGGEPQNARLDETRSAGTHLVYSLQLQNFADVEGARTAEFLVTVVDRAGNELTRTVPVQIDARPLTFEPELDVVPDRKDFYVLDPKSMPVLAWKSNRAVEIAIVARDVQKKDIVEITREPKGDGIQLKLPPSTASYEGAIKIDANDLRSVFHADDARGRQQRTLGYRYETRNVTVVVLPQSPDGSPLATGSGERSFVTNGDSIILVLAREQVAVSVEVECRHGDKVTLQDSAALHLEGLKQVKVPIDADGRHDLEVRGYRYSGPNVPRTEKPEFVQKLVVVKDTRLPELRLTTTPTLIAGPVDASAAWFGIEVGDDSEEPLRLAWVLEGPSPKRGEHPLPAGARHTETVTWQQLTVDPEQLEDGSYKLQLTAVDAAANRSATAVVGEFVIARRGPRLVLKSPSGSEWLALRGNTFQVVVEASDNNGVGAVECTLEAGALKTTLALQPVGSDVTRTEWVGQCSMPAAWSQKAVQVRWQGSDRNKNPTAEGIFSTNLPAFEVPRASRIWFEVIGVRADIQPMRFVKGDPNYVFGGRTKEEEDEAFLEYDLGVTVRCETQRKAVGDYYLDENEVTVRQYGAFLTAPDGYMNAKNWTDQDGGGRMGGPLAERSTALQKPVTTVGKRLPMTGIDWYEAAAYARWVGKRLPTKVEWEYAVRGGSAYRPFSCASKGFRNEDLCVDRSEGPWEIDRGGDTTPTGVGEGIRNLCSNVSEWTASFGPDPERMLVAGASCSHVAFHFAIMAPQPPTERRDTLGFRCATHATDVDAALAQPRPGRIRILITDPAPDPKAR